MTCKVLTTLSRYYDEKMKATLLHSGQKREMWFLTEDEF